jgi:PleD family two-component response regulator
MAKTLQAAATRGGDLVARYGGEECAIILPDSDEAGALALASLRRCET